MSDEVFLNNLNARIKIVIQYMMHNLDVQSQQQSSDSATNTISFLIFKLKEIKYYDSELNTQYDEKNIVTIEKDSYT